MPSFRYAVADVFADEPLAGNPVAVFTDARDLTDRTMQALARELSLSETAFVLPARGDAHVRLRIFTPTTELPFAGHPALGAAFVLAAPLQLAEIRLELVAGIVSVRLEREGARVVFGRMDQPVPTWRPYERGRDLLAALRVERATLPVEIYDNGPRHAFVALARREEVAAVEPDLTALARFDIGVSCFAGDATAWKTRMFAPGLGIAEDPATGSAAGPLAVHLARHGRIAWGEEIEIEQGAELGRPSRLYAAAFGSEDSLERVEVAGSAVVVARGEFRL